MSARRRRGRGLRLGGGETAGAAARGEQLKRRGVGGNGGKCARGGGRRGRSDGRRRRGAIYSAWK